MLRKEKKCFKLDLEIKELTIYTYVVYDIIWYIGTLMSMMKRCDNK